MKGVDIEALMVYCCLDSILIHRDDFEGTNFEAAKDYGLTLWHLT